MLPSTPTELPKRALVVEGGGMRGIFSTGVLDGLLDRRYRPFDFCLGVSAGSTNLAAWLARQRGRNHKVITDYSCRPQFISFKRFLLGGHWLDLDWLWEITIREIRLDLEAFDQQPIPLYVVTTKVADGQAAYIRATADNLEQLLKASCSVPIVYREFTVLKGEQMTDGGVADSIPVIKAYEMGARDITVILSRPNGYRKTPPPNALAAAPPAVASPPTGRSHDQPCGAIQPFHRFYRKPTGRMPHSGRRAIQWIRRWPHDDRPGKTAGGL